MASETRRTVLVAMVANLVIAIAKGVAGLVSGAAAMLAEAARGKGVSIRRLIRETSDPTTKTVLFEDSAAVVGIVLAFGGVGLRELTGSAVWDGGASIAIGIVLVAVAYRLGRDTRDLLL